MTSAPGPGIMSRCNKIWKLFFAAAQSRWHPDHCWISILAVAKLGASMRIGTSAATASALVALLAFPALAQQPVWYAWSPKPDKLTPYGNNRPVTRLSAVL